MNVSDRSEVTTCYIRQFELESTVKDGKYVRVSSGIICDLKTQTFNIRKLVKTFKLTKNISHGFICKEVFKRGSFLDNDAQARMTNKRRQNK